ncbi:hypothetical protein BT67DRAFT_381628, partial [Trichocladium antarcticum]
FLIVTTNIVRFLRGQINRHCLLFEYILSRTSLMFLLTKTIPIVIALQGLRFCYSSNTLFKESLLFSNE